MKTTRVLIVDTVTRSVREEQWDGSPAQMHKWVGASCVDSASGPWQDGVRAIVFVDDIGTMTNKLKWFWPEFYKRPLIGNAVIFGADRRGETVDVPYTLDDLNGRLFFQDLLSDLDPRRIPQA